MTELNLASQISMLLFVIGLSLAFISICFVFYLKAKWLPFVENVIDGDCYSFSSNIFSAGLGITRYALIFLFDWQARRCNRYEEKDKVPLKIQRLFIINQLLVFIGAALLFGGGMLE
ncbi:hypothetical protein [Psychromonas antarctica]|uniref:hypothetical protein n=1 Tax=Psychromonas antarctica TaxID=67573 RepID=UPI001EE8533F|nr:hypothetical protein [Psychromonas antarctica]MCG6202615.1 hypothetical protein [Psychromonas antarctica]